ncbi:MULTISPECIES: erythromycin esterase family protein [Actinoalloteichus]|uniref:Erythromycin esterase-like enzyme n=1 Tax=Actinoalloteichus fjordicus TaxID=1612552 RepID=A0AAC9PTB6_9PSEU|nr:MULTISPECIES: erythromycin esterase family protein [Actinoalloteichus]APU16489.1 erythromycin esterase-like enzyme [Actinoalloteichus fjordicus]APU22548.1 erythromycin esterase-like enzyme [Actinoalloteichus sp. GBA129-24]
MRAGQDFASWIAENAITSHSLDPAAPPDDLEPLRELIGDARVVAIGESSHHVEEYYRLRHRMLRFLVERCGFTDYVFEAPLTASKAVDDWIRGGAGTVTAAVADADLDLCRCGAMRDTLAWLRDHNRDAARPVRFTGALAGSGGSSLADLHEVAAYLGADDPDALPLVERAIDAIRHYHDDVLLRSIQNYASVEEPIRDALTAALSRLSARMLSMTGTQADRGRGAEHRAASLLVQGAWRLDHLHRDVSGSGLAIGSTSLDAFMAEVVLHRLAEGGPAARVVLALHNVHLRATPVAHDGPAGLHPTGRVLREALGDDYVAIAVTTDGGQAVTGELDPDAPLGISLTAGAVPPLLEGSMETAFRDVDAPLTIADLRAARGRVTDVGSFHRMRSEDGFLGVPVFEAFDAVARLHRTSCTEDVPLG